MCGRKFLRRKESGLLWHSCRYICKMSEEKKNGRRKSTNFNDTKSSETPAAEMNYATHQKERMHSNIHHNDARFCLAKRSGDFPHSVCLPTAVLASNNRCQQCQLPSTAPLFNNFLTKKRGKKFV